MLRRCVTHIALLAGLALGTAIPNASARDKDKEPQPRPALVQQLFDCRTLSDAAERLACYDKQVAGLQAAEASRDISFADRAMVKKARRGLFGFSFPKLGGLFGTDEDDTDQVSSIETVIKSIRTDRSGRLIITMEDGAVWEQIDTLSLPRDPKPGQKILIKVATLGSYFASINGGRSIRMRRVQ